MAKLEFENKSEDKGTSEEVTEIILVAGTRVIAEKRSDSLGR